MFFPTQYLFYNNRRRTASKKAGIRCILEISLNFSARNCITMTNLCLSTGDSGGFYSRNWKTSSKVPSKGNPPAACAQSVKSARPRFLRLPVSGARRFRRIKRVRRVLDEGPGFTFPPQPAFLYNDSPPGGEFCRADGFRARVKRILNFLENSLFNRVKIVYNLYVVMSA